MLDEDRIADDLMTVGLMPDSYDLLPLDRLRRTIAERMTATIRDVPHFPLNTRIRIDALDAARADHNGRSGIRLSLNDLIVKAAGLALIDVPEVNSSYHPQAIIRHRSADVAVVVAIPGGLITPIVRSVEDTPISAIASALRDLQARAQKMRLKPEEYIGGSFSISNLGMYGVESFGSIINQPHGAILSVGAARREIVPADDGTIVATIMRVTLTCDHRVIDGVAGARWLQAFRSRIEEPDALFGTVAKLRRPPFQADASQGGGV